MSQQYDYVPGLVAVTPWGTVLGQEMAVGEAEEVDGLLVSDGCWEGRAEEVAELLGMVACWFVEESGEAEDYGVVVDG